MDSNLQTVSDPFVRADLLGYAGFWIRFFAYLIDTIIVSIGVFALMLPLQFIGNFDPEESVAGTLLLVVIVFVGPWLYSALMESSPLQATLGKKALGIKVGDLDGNRISFGRATGRYFAKIISNLILYIGFIMIAFTRKKQGLHDLIAGCTLTRD
jgi:uncharacterized RDD family membrane protein YckC